MRTLALVLLLLVSSCGCNKSADVLAEEQRLRERMDQLDQLKMSIKELPRLQAQVRQVEAENKMLRARLKNQHP